MIRFLQKDNKFVKAILTVGISAFIISMVIYLIPGVFQDSSQAGDTYATIYPHWYSRYTFTGEKIPMVKVQEMAEQQLQRQRLPEFAMPYMIQQAGQRLILQKLLISQAGTMGINASEQDVRNYIQTQLGEYFFPNGQFVGEEKYPQIVSQLTGGLSTADFEKEVHDLILIHRLEQMVTGGVTVSDSEIRDQYRKQNRKIKFAYAVISQDDLRKTIKPSDSDLEAFFKSNAARYAQAVPEQRKITYFSFTADQIPGGLPKISDAEIQSYYTAHQADYQVPEQSRARHILIKFPGGAAKTDADAKAKAEDLLKQLKAGGNFADLAKKNSEDTGSGAQGGELGFARRGTMVPEFDQAIFNNKIGDLALVKTQFGYHIVQVEERQTAHTQPLSDVKPTIEAMLTRQKQTQAESNYAQSLASEAAKNGLAKTADAHGLHLVTTDPLSKNSIISSLPDGTQVVTKAFSVKLNDAPASAPTGEGYAIFQVTGINAAHAPTFAEYKDHIASDYADEKLPALLSQKTKELDDKAKASGDLDKAAKEVGATVKTSDLVGDSGQVPDFGQVGSIAPELFDLKVGDISGPINAQRTGVVAKILDKQEPTADEIAKNLDATRDQVLDQHREEAFGIFVSSLQDKYKKANLIRVNAKLAKAPMGGE
ncbi:MAG TPA: peptidylprolyl isomerase [Acidobacteriaceae bacterium]|nr:peptidylprolyl isomerase [Acidobacteriaceae bacterium]